MTNGLPPGPLSGVDSGSFTIPTTGEDATNVFYRVHLSATDTGAPVGASAALSSSTFVDVLPNVSDLTLAVVPAASDYLKTSQLKPTLLQSPNEKDEEIQEELVVPPAATLVNNLKQVVESQ